MNIKGRSGLRTEPLDSVKFRGQEKEEDLVKEMEDEKPARVRCHQLPPMLLIGPIGSMGGS